MKKEVIDLVNSSEKELENIFRSIDEQCYKNSMKVLNAFHKYNLSESDLNGTTGYGYNDIGRDKIEQIYSDIFKSEDALVRSQFISGSHAISVSLQALLRPNDMMLSITGTPYDTLHEVIGIKDNDSSLKSYGVIYKQIDLRDSKFDYDKIEKEIKKNKIKLIHIQRSRGYSLRDSIDINSLGNVITFIKNIDSNIIIFVDNCYCEFVEDISPIEVNADIAVGSLIKNLGASEALNGGYAVGRKDLIKLISERLNLPGEGKEVGPSLNTNRSILKGLYLSPIAVSSSLKIACLTSKTLEKIGIRTSPLYNETRCDIVELIYLNNEEKIIKYSQGIQSSGAIDSNVSSIPSPMPGYDNNIIMSSPSFVQGSSIEISCDAPIREPYVLYQQGSITYEYGKIAIINAISNIIE